MILGAEQSINPGAHAVGTLTASSAKPGERRTNQADAGTVRVRSLEYTRSRAILTRLCGFVGGECGAPVAWSSRAPAGCVAGMRLPRTCRGLPSRKRRRVHGG